MNTSISDRPTCIKDLLDLDRDKPIIPGDFVTTDDKIPELIIYVLKEIRGSTAIIYGLEITASKDDVFVYQAYIHSGSLIHVDESHVNQNGALYKVHELILSGNADKIITFSR